MNILIRFVLGISGSLFFACIGCASENSALEMDDISAFISESDFLKKVPRAVLVAENKEPVNRRSYLYSTNRRVIDGKGQLFAVGRDFKNGIGCGFGFGMKVNEDAVRQILLENFSMGARLVKTVKRSKGEGAVLYYETDKYFIKLSWSKEGEINSIIQYHSTLVSCGNVFAQLVRTKERLRNQ